METTSTKFEAVKRLALKYFLKSIAGLYALGALLHLADLFDWRLEFSGMNLIWKIWTIFLILSDSLTAIGIFKFRMWGIVGFLVVASSQLLAYLFFADTFYKQPALIIFHLVTLMVFFYLVYPHPKQALKHWASMDKR
jgi:hypothetical protein